MPTDRHKHPPTLRVFQIAKQLNVSLREVLDALSDIGVSATSNLTPVDQKTFELLQRELAKFAQRRAAAEARLPTLKPPQNRRESRDYHVEVASRHYRSHRWADA